MPITSGGAGDKLVLRIFKHLTTRPDANWVNNYEFVTTGAWTQSDLTAAAVDWGVFEKMFHSSTVVFDRITWSTWSADSTPYNPANFYGFPFAGGTVGELGFTEANEALALDVTLWVARQVATGRQGKLFYRATLGEQYVTAPAGVVTPQASGWKAQFENAIENIEPYLEGHEQAATPDVLQLALIGKTGLVRRVNNLVARGVAINKRDRAYFDRS